MRHFVAMFILTSVMGWSPHLSAMLDGETGDRGSPPLQADEDKGTPRLTLEPPFEGRSHVLQSQQDELTALRAENAEKTAECAAMRAQIAAIMGEGEERERGMGAEIQRLGYMLREREEDNETLQRGRAALRDSLHQSIERLFEEQREEQERAQDAQRARHADAERDYMTTLPPPSFGAQRSGFDLWDSGDQTLPLAADYDELKKGVVSAFVCVAKAGKVNTQIEAAFVSLIKGEPAVLQGYEHDLREMMLPVPVARPVAIRPGESAPSSKPNIPARFQGKAAQPPRR